MADLRRWFRENIARVKADADNGNRELAERLKRMTPAEFLRLPRQTYESLTAAQYREIVATIAPDTRLPTPPVMEEVTPDTRTWRDWWRECSTLMQVLAVTIATTLIVVMATIATPLAWQWLMNRVEIVRPISTATWPVCHRLSPYTDGCVYRPAQALNWAWVAQQLGMSLEELYAANRHLPPQYIPANATLVVWRHRGRLEQ